jgi:uncharacterized protein (DUF952 family)
MWPHRLFLVVDRRDWAAAWRRVLLTRRRLRQREFIRCCSATRVPELCSGTTADQLLLRVDPAQVQTFCTGGFGEVRLFGDLPVAAVERVYALPLTGQSPFGVPPDCEELYKGERVREQADALPTVPSAEEVEGFILQALRAWRADPSIPAAEVLEAIEDVRSRLEWESISAAVARGVEAWKKEAGLPPAGT